MALFSSIMDFLANILVGAIHLSLIDLNRFVLVTYSICLYVFIFLILTVGFIFSGGQ